MLSNCSPKLSQKAQRMRVTPQEMDSSHHRIVDGAARLLRERGVRSTSVADAMNEAGMTHGGFYRHFKTKDELVIEALARAFEDFSAPLEQQQQFAPPKAVVDQFKALYLSDEHVAHPGQGCPMPAMGSDLAREAAPVKGAFGAGLQRVVAALANAQEGNPQQRQAAALRQISMWAGAVMLARASDPQTAAAVLDACRD